MSSQATVNGEMDFSSEFLSHVSNYPLVSESISYYKSAPLGAKSIDIASNLYASYGRPILPYFQTPISIVSPYARQLDHLGASTLDNLDAHVPAVKNTGFKELGDGASAAAHYPFRIAGEGRDYVVGTYSDERNKTGDAGLLGAGRAVLSTELRIASDGLHYVADYLGPKKDRAQDQLNRLAGQGADKAGELKKAGEQKAGEAKKVGEQKAGEAKKAGEQKKQQLANGN